MMSISAKKNASDMVGYAMRGEPTRTHLVIALELTVALLTTFLSVILLDTMANLHSTAPLSAAGIFRIALPARSLLALTLLTAILIFVTIVCHDFSSLCSKC
jgi:hypothetical protein